MREIMIKMNRMTLVFCLFVIAVINAFPTAYKFHVSKLNEFFTPRFLREHLPRGMDQSIDGNDAEVIEAYVGSTSGK